MAVAVVLACYLAAAAVVTGRLWAHPASHMVAGNPNDADYFAWIMRYSATAMTHGRLPALVTTAMNAPQGINLMWNNSMLLPGVLLAPVTAARRPADAPDRADHAGLRRLGGQHVPGAAALGGEHAGGRAGRCGLRVLARRLLQSRSAITTCSSPCCRR